MTRNACAWLVCCPLWLAAIAAAGCAGATQMSVAESVGPAPSNSNVAEHGIDQEEGRAAIWEIDLRIGSHRVFATGLRTPVGMAWETELGALWVAVNERNELGPDLMPDYMTAAKPNGFYGWPYSYYGGHVDDRVSPQH